MVKEFLNYLQEHEGLLQGGYSHVLQMHRGPEEEIDLLHLKKIVLKHCSGLSRDVMGSPF